MELRKDVGREEEELGLGGGKEKLSCAGGNNIFDIKPKCQKS